MTNFNNSLKLKDLNSFKFEAFGVKIEVKATSKTLLNEVYERTIKALPKNFKFIESESVEHTFEINYHNNGAISFSLDGETSKHKSKDVLFNYLESKIRLTVAEHAVSKVFIHAGVVAFENRAIVIPASSYAGKTTIVKELLRIGATYYSDEYAVLDEKGRVHPFPKTLSVRGIVDDRQQIEIPAKEFGGDTGIQPCKVHMILITKYENGAEFIPNVLLPGEGIMEIIPHTLPIRLKTKFTFQVLNKVATNAIICKSYRGEAKTAAKQILNYFNKSVKD